MNTKILWGAGLLAGVGAWYLWRKKEREVIARQRMWINKPETRPIVQAEPIIKGMSAVRSVTGQVQTNPRDRKFCHDHCSSWLSYGRECHKRQCKELYASVS